MPSTRYTLRLPPALDRAVQAHLQTTGTPFAVLMREALSAYLADTPPTAPLTAPLTPADSADTLRAIQDHLADLTIRVKVLEEILTHADRSADSPADRAADRSADRARTPADTPTRRARGQRKLTPRQIRALRDKHLRGVPIPALMEEYGISKPGFQA
jgi:hypothetical protein